MPCDCWWKKRKINAHMRRQFHAVYRLAQRNERKKIMWISDLDDLIRSHADIVIRIRWKFRSSWTWKACIKSMLYILILFIFFIGISFSPRFYFVWKWKKSLHSPRRTRALKLQQTVFGLTIIVVAVNSCNLQLVQLAIQRTPLEWIRSIHLADAKSLPLRKWFIQILLGVCWLVWCPVIAMGFLAKKTRFYFSG